MGYLRDNPLTSLGGLALGSRLFPRRDKKPQPSLLTQTSPASSLMSGG